MATDDRITAALQSVLDRGETGVSIAVYHRGRLIINAQAGVSDTASNHPVDSETLFPVFSVSKGITALAVHIQADRGYLNLENPVSEYWPEFVAHGKDNITIGQDWMVKQVADLKPIFPCGTVNAYHVLIWGWILGEVVRRTDPQRRSFDLFVTEEILNPLGIRDLYFGVPTESLSRVATLYDGNASFTNDTYNTNPATVFPGSTIHNLPIVQQTVDPGAGAIGTAPAIARIFALIAEGGELDGVRLLSRGRVMDFARIREGAHDPDKILPIPVWFGSAGFWLGGEKGASDPLVGDHCEIIYSPGARNSIAWADLRDRIVVSICHNNMDVATMTDPEPIWAPIGRAIREVIGGLSGPVEGEH